MTDRDIDLALITGAGASRDLGAGSQNFPLMGDWSRELSKHLASKGSEYLEVTQLRGIEDGEEFEARLGLFLRRVQAFRQIEPLVPFTKYFPSIPQPLIGSDLIEAWYEQAKHLFEKVNDAIFESLYIEFAARRIDSARAAKAYSALLSALGIQPNTKKWFLATTNYDTVAERALHTIGFNCDTGVRSELYAGAEGVLFPDKIIQEIQTRAVPIIHLHGRVGWFQRDDGTTYATNAERYDITSGTPLVTLPDPQKTPLSTSVIQTLWEEFRVGLSRAKCVFVLGHSLNDQLLVTALREDVDQKARIAVAILGVDTNAAQYAKGTEQLQQRVQETIGGAVTTFPVHFGGEMRRELLEKIANWRSQVDRIDG